MNDFAVILTDPIEYDRLLDIQIVKASSEKEAIEKVLKQKTSYIDKQCIKAILTIKTEEWIDVPLELEVTYLYEDANNIHPILKEAENE